MKANKETFLWNVSKEKEATVGKKLISKERKKERRKEMVILK